MPTEPASRAARLDRVLANLLAQTREIEAAAVVSFDGLPMASALPAGMDEDRVAAMSAALLSLGERAAVGLGRGELSQIYIEGSEGTVFLVAAQDEGVLVAVTAPGAKVGMMLYEVRLAAAGVAEVLVDDQPAPVPAAPAAPVPPPAAPPAPAAAPVAAAAPAPLASAAPSETADYGATYAPLHAAEPAPGEYTQPEYAPAEHAQPEYSQSEYAQAGYEPAEYAQPSYAQPSYALPEYPQPEHTQPAQPEGEHDEASANGWASNYTGGSLPPEQNSWS